MRKRDFKVGDQVYITEREDLWFGPGNLTYDIEHMRSVEVGTIVGETEHGSYKVKFWTLPESMFLFYNYEMIHADL